MKKLIILIVCISAFVSCKKDAKSQGKNESTVISSEDVKKTENQEEDLTLLKGEFVYYQDAAVLQTHGKIYGVFVTDKMLELNKLAEKYKSESTDMVNIEVRGKVSNKKDDKILWENKLEIIEILNVSPQSKENNNVVKLGNQ